MRRRTYVVPLLDEDGGIPKELGGAKYVIKAARANGFDGIISEYLVWDDSKFIKPLLHFLQSKAYRTQIDRERKIKGLGEIFGKKEAALRIFLEDCPEIRTLRQAEKKMIRGGLLPQLESKTNSPARVGVHQEEILDDVGEAAPYKKAPVARYPFDLIADTNAAMLAAGRDRDQYVKHLEQGLAGLRKEFERFVLATHKRFALLEARTSKQEETLVADVPRLGLLYIEAQRLKQYSAKRLSKVMLQKSESEDES